MVDPVVDSCGKFVGKYTTPMDIKNVSELFFVFRKSLKSRQGHSKTQSCS